MQVGEYNRLNLTGVNERHPFYCEKTKTEDLLTKIFLYTTIEQGEVKFKQFCKLILTCKRFKEIGDDQNVNNRIFKNIFDWKEVVKFKTSAMARRILNCSTVDPSADGDLAIRTVTVFGRTEFGYIETIRELLKDKRVNPSPAFELASRDGRLEIVRLLIEDGRVDPSEEVLELAIKNDHPEVVKELLKDKRVNPSTAFRLAIEHGRSRIVKLLLENGQKATPSHLLTASKKGHALVVEVLIKEGKVDPSSYDNAAYKEAEKRGYMGIVRLLKEDSRVTSFFN